MKIINIASSDNFEDILGAVRASESDSMILVVPKSNRVFKSKSKVEKLKTHFDRLKKKVSIISSGQEVIKNANLAGLDIFKKKGEISEGKDKEISSFYSEPSGGLNQKKPPKESKKFILFLISSAIALFLFIVFVSLSGADIKIIPRKDDFSVNIPVIVSDKITTNDEFYGMVPGKWIEAEKVISKTFVSGAEKDVFQKARGRITIYNNFSASPQILVATTRFQTPEGLVFRILKTVTVPGAAKTGNESKPGRIEVEVIADRAGEEYNLDPSDFRVPGFLGTPKYQGFYAKSFEKFSGGFVGRSNFVSKEDMEKAGEAVEEEGAAKIKAEMASLGNFKILSEAMILKTEKTSDSNSVGDLVKEFKMGLKIKTKALIFKEEDVVDFIRQYIESSQGRLVIKNGLQINYDDLNLDEEKRELSFKLVASGQNIEIINEDKIVSDIAGIRKNEAEAYFKNLSGVESVKVLSPFWLRRMPKDKTRINVEIAIE